MAFDAERFFQGVEQKRQEERLSWRQLGGLLELSPSTFSRMAQGRRPDIDTFMKLLAWLGSPADDFMSPGAARTQKGSGERSDTVSDIARSLRTDPALQPQDADALEQIVRVAYHRFRGN